MNPTPAHLSAPPSRLSFPLRATPLLATVCLAAFVCAVPAEAQPAQDARAIAFAQQLGDAFASVAERSADSVVSIQVEAQRRGRYRGQSETVRGGGSGVVFRADGHILTNNHVVGTASAIQVRLHDGRTFPAEIVGTDPATDLAVIKIEATGLPAARFARREGIRVGEWAIAVGSPFGLDYTVTAGIVSALGRGGVGMNEIEDYVQTDASINPGNSGGPLLNLRGEVIGINTMIVGRSSGIGFAVVSELADQVAGQIIDGGEVRRAYVGVSFQELTPALARHVQAPPNTRGALVAGVDPEGPAAGSGLQAGDVITRVNGTRLETTNDLIRRVLASPIGATLELAVIRGGRDRVIQVQTSERPGVEDSTQPSQTPPSHDRFGLSLEGGRRGVRVAGVQEGSVASRAGLVQDDVIVAADRRRVRDPRAVHAALRDGSALLRVQRGRGALFISIQTRPTTPARGTARHGR
ncbi:MAG: serine protease Do [Polyangiales bacterium]|jgi:serine protease Do